jgi:predicted MFS family arabinose efflux permease
VIIGLVLGSLVGGIASDRAERHFSSQGRILASQFSLLALVPAMLGFVFLARNPVEVVGCAFVIAFLLHLTYPKEYRRLRQQMVQRRDLLANTETDGPGPVL